MGYKIVIVDMCGSEINRKTYYNKTIAESGTYAYHALNFKCNFIHYIPLLYIQAMCQACLTSTYYQL